MFCFFEAYMNTWQWEASKYGSCIYQQLLSLEKNQQKCTETGTELNTSFINTFIDTCITDQSAFKSSCASQK